MKRRAVAYAPLGLWAAAVLVVGSLQLGRSPLPSGSDKAAHFVMYGVGGALAALAGRLSGTSGWAGLAFVALVGAVDELHQRVVPGRHGDLEDWVADMAGALVFYVLVRRLPEGRSGRG